VIGLLAIAAIVVAVTSAIAMLLLHAVPDIGDHDQGTFAAVWQAMVRTIDPGQITTDHGPAAAIGLVTTIFGLLLISTLISIVNNQVERRVDRVKRGRDPVRLRRPRRRDNEPVPYYVVLGWTDLTLRLLEELTDSHLPHQPPDVLVMAPMPYEDMVQQVEEYRQARTLGLAAPTTTIRQRLPHDRDWPQVRTGLPTDTRDLHHIAAITHADAVIILAPDPPDGMTPSLSRPDEMCPATAEVVKTVMAVSASLPDRHHVTEAGIAACTPVKRPTVVVELPETMRPDSRLADRLRTRICDADVDLVTVDVAAIQSSLAADVSRTAGLAAIYRDLLDFKGAEFHLVDPGPTIHTFGEAVASMRNGIIVGTVDGDGHTDLWPGWDDDVTGKQLVSFQDDASEPIFDPDAPAESGRRKAGAGALTQPEQILIIGWNHRTEHLIRSLDHRLPQGSSVRVITSVRDVPEMKLPNIGAVSFTHLDSGVQRWLDTAPKELGCDHAIILGDDLVPPSVSDANVLLTLLALRPPHAGAEKPDTVVAELRQRPNRHLASQRFSDDLIVGDSLVAMTLAQFAVEPALSNVLHELISPVSTHPLEIRLVPVSRYVTSPGSSFRSIQADVRSSDGSIALGYRIIGDIEATVDHIPIELHLNPDGDVLVPAPAGDRVELIILTKCERSVNLHSPAQPAPTQRSRTTHDV